MGMGELNLAKEMIWPAKIRSRIYKLILLYLLAVLILLPLAARRAVTAVSEGLEFRRQTQTILSRFKQDNPGQSGPLASANSLRNRVQENSKKASAIGAALPATTYSVIPVLDLLMSQHDDSRVNKLMFIQQNREQKPELEFSINFPVRGGADAPAFLRTWRNNPRLVSQFNGLVPATTERGTFMKEDVQITSYKAVWRGQ